jgi:hypothetical protein
MDEGTHVTPGPPQDDLQSLLQHRPNASRSKSTVLLAAIALVAVGFIGGLFVGKSMGDDTQQAAFPGGFGQNGPAFATGANGNGGGFPGGNATIGTIKSIDGDTITLQTMNGDTVTVNVGSDTQIQVTKDGSVGDLGTGDTVVVAGTQKSGAIDASSITEGGAAIPVGSGQGGSG